MSGARHFVIGADELLDIPSSSKEFTSSTVPEPPQTARSEPPHAVSPAALTIYAFGVTALTFGIISLLLPEHSLSTLGLQAACLPAANGNALAAIAMGIYYTLAAYQDNVAFFKLTVPMRLLTTFVFWRQGGSWRMPAIWEGLGALSTGLALALS